MSERFELHPAKRIVNTHYVTTSSAEPCQSQQQNYREGPNPI